MTSEGTVKDLDAWAGFLFTLPELLRPNYDSAFDVLVTNSSSGKLDSAIMNIPAGSGKVTIKGIGGKAPTGLLSLTRSFFVPLEASGTITLDLQSGWKTKEGQAPYYHALDMGIETALPIGQKPVTTLCSLTGTLTTSSWGKGNIKNIAQLDPKCTQNYSKGFW